MPIITLPNGQQINTDPTGKPGPEHREGTGIARGAWDWLRSGEEEKNRKRKEAEGNLSGYADEAGGFARTSQEDFRRLGQEAAQQRQYLQRIARGEESVSAGQLQKSLQQNQAAQQSMAASARPGNSAMAARTAAMTAGRQGAGLAGQQAEAGLKERQAAQMALQQALLQQRQQELGATTSGRGQALNAYGQILGGSPAGATSQEQMLDYIKTGASLYGAGG